MVDFYGGSLNPNVYVSGSGVGSYPPSANSYSAGMPISATPADSFEPSSQQDRKKKNQNNNAQLFLMAAAGMAAAIATGILCKKVFFPKKLNGKSTPAKSFDTSSVNSLSSSAASVAKQPLKSTKISSAPISKGGGKRVALHIGGMDRFVDHTFSVLTHPSSWIANRSWMGNISKCEDSKYFSPALKSTLSKITAKDTLVLTAHGNTSEIACFNPKQLADFLKRHGLREVGMIKLKSCETGMKQERNSYLENLAKELKKQKISFKAVQGYEGLYNPAYKVVFLQKPNGKYHNFRSVRASKATRTIYQTNV